MSLSTPALRSPHPYSFGPLYDLLLDCFPSYKTVQGVFDIQKFAKALGVSHETIYRAVRKDTISVVMAKKVIAHSEHLTSRKHNPIDAPVLTRVALLDYLFG